MVTLAEIDAQLSKIGIRKTRLSAPEIKQLQHILLEDEQILEFVSGRYHGGFAILVATPRRLLLVDKKPLYLTVDDIRYDMIAEIDVSSRMFDTTLILHTINKQHNFRSIRQSHLRSLASYVQKRVMEVRHYEETHRHYAAASTSPSLPTHSELHPHHLSASQVKNVIWAHLPRPHLHRAVGATAVAASRTPYFNPNPYTRGALVSRIATR